MDVVLGSSEGTVVTAGFTSIRHLTILKFEKIKTNTKRLQKYFMYKLVSNQWARR